MEYLQTALNDFSESLTRSDEAPPADLLPPKIIRESVSQLASFFVILLVKYFNSICVEGNDSCV